MRKKMALLLVLAMIVTSSITVPFVSFADDSNAPKKIENIYGAETVVKTAPTKSESEDGLKYTAEYTYSPEWNLSILLNAPLLVVQIEDETPVDPTPVDPAPVDPTEEGDEPVLKDVSLNPIITVKDANGEIVNPFIPPIDPPEDPGTPTEPISVVSTEDTPGDSGTDTPVEQRYDLLKDGKYTITLEYISESKIINEVTNLSLLIKVAADTESLKMGTAEEPNVLEIKDIGNDEKWYAVEVNTTDNKGALFSLVSGVENDSDKTKIGYSAEIYKDKDVEGIVTWNDEYGRMLECPLLMSTGTYYVRVFPNHSSIATSSIKLSASAISATEIDAEARTPVAIPEGEEGKSLTLYSYQNLDKSYHWYKIEPSITDAKSAAYEFAFDFADSEYGEVNIELWKIINNGKAKTLITDGGAYAGSENNTLYVDLEANESYLLNLEPMDENLPKVNLKVTVKKHTCEDRWFVSDEDCCELSYGCLCGVDGSLKATCILDEQLASTVTYTGKALSPQPTPVLDDWWLEDGVEEYPEFDWTGWYNIKFKNSKGVYIDTIKSIGKYTAIIQFCSNLGGLEDVTKTIKVIPIGTTMKSVSAGKKSFTVKWNKKITQTTGYQIQYSTSSKFSSGNKTVTITSNKTTSKKISKLKAKKKYYVRIRTYKTVSGTKYYSKWSGYRKVTTKK